MKFNPELGDQIVRAVTVGNFRKSAAEIAGVTDRSIRNWLKRGAEYDKAIEAGEDVGSEVGEQFSAFRRDLLQAEAEFENSLVQNIVAAGADDWRASAWLLERRTAHHWLVSTKLEHVVARGEDDGEGDADSGKLTVVIVDHGGKANPAEDA